jgi:CO/xanthine dehydrogenase FAD-binding subunit
MIIEYHRPETLKQALELLAREHVTTVPMGGGTVLNRPGGPEVAVVDLQDLDLNTIEKQGKSLQIGATVRLQELLSYTGLSNGLQKAIRHECTYNLRQMGTVAGTLMAADGRSAFATAMLALDPQIDIIHPTHGEEQLRLADLLFKRDGLLAGGLIVRISLPNNVRLAYEYVARTPADLPIVCAGVAAWPSGRTRVVLGGFGQVPLLAADGPEPDGMDLAAQSAYSAAGDQWASADYRSAVAKTLVGRCLASLED